MASDKLPWFAFYPADYLTDTRHLSPASKGIWMDLICHLWRSPTRGTLHMNFDKLAQFLGVDNGTLTDALLEFKIYNTCNVTEANDFVTIESRRMSREEKVRIGNRLRQTKHRQSRQSNSDVTVYNHNQKSESEINPSYSPLTGVTEAVNPNGFTSIKNLLPEVKPMPTLPESRAERIHEEYYDLRQACRKHQDVMMIAKWNQLEVRLTDAHCPECRRTPYQRQA